MDLSTKDPGFQFGPFDNCVPFSDRLEDLFNEIVNLIFQRGSSAPTQPHSYGPVIFKNYHNLN